jgi:2-oxoacid:acceptor oxidoreductase delta subunit (pyruvate/2-ketoisovalerate family)
MELPFAITLEPDTGLRNKTGTWRSQRPQYVSLMPPCNHACPAGENTQEWLYHAEEGRYEDAWRAIVRDNPFPAIHGRVCYHPCETSCNRGQMTDGGGPVSIHAVERFLGDLAIQKGWDVECAPSSGKKVLVVGSGPCGLACAYHLARLGHKVTIYEAGKKVGGMMRYGIPAYRLPRDILDAEIDRISRMGVTFVTDHKVDEPVFTKSIVEFDAIFLGIGAGAGKHVDIPASQAGRIIDAISFLQEAAEGKTSIQIGRRVAVYGGGNTAMDAARVAKRLGAQETVIIYRRDRDHAPAHQEEIQEALDEGVIVHWLRTIKAVEGEDLRVEVMKLDEKGKPAPTGQYETLKAPDTVILALGQDPQSEWLKLFPHFKIMKEGSIEIDDHMMTGFPGVFAGGDMVPFDRTVTTAVGHGKKAARNIDAYLRGTRYIPRPKPPLAEFDRLNTWYYSDAPKSIQPQLDRLRRQASFDETIGGLDESTALYEARRCLSCGNCFGCDNCYGLCPDNAIIKRGTADFEVNFDYCKGCGVCAEECPCGAIDMTPESV